SPASSSPSRAAQPATGSEGSDHFATSAAAPSTAKCSCAVAAKLRCSHLVASAYTTRPGPPTPAVTFIRPEANPPPAPTHRALGTCKERDRIMNTSPAITSTLTVIASTTGGCQRTRVDPAMGPTSPAGT